MAKIDGRLSKLIFKIALSPLVSARMTPYQKNQELFWQLETRSQKDFLAFEEYKVFNASGRTENKIVKNCFTHTKLSRKEHKMGLDGTNITSIQGISETGYESRVPQPLLLRQRTQADNGCMEKIFSFRNDDTSSCPVLWGLEIGKKIKRKSCHS